MEICQDIYANSEVITRRDQNKNSDYKTAGCYRWTTGGLLLLCVLLLPVIVVLIVKNNQLQISNNNLTMEKDQLQTSYNNLTIKNDQLQTSYNNLTIENNQLQKENEICQNVFSHLEQKCTYFKSSVYSITAENKSWSDSRQVCKQTGGDLVIVNSKEEQIFLNRCFPNTTAWIGLNDIAREGTFMWVDGTALNTGFWWDGEPNNYDGNEDCVATGYMKAKDPLKNWNDNSCNILLVGICEKKLFYP